MVYTPTPPFVPLTKLCIVPPEDVCSVAPIYIVPETILVTVRLVEAILPINIQEKLRDEIIVPDATV
jgi:hypothetical protein